MKGIILAGGLSTRMGGGNKGLRVLAGETLLSRVIRRLTPQCAPLAINANGAPDAFDDYDLPVISDGFAGFAGPLAGVLAGMEWAEALGADSVVSAGSTPAASSPSSRSTAPSSMVSAMVLVPWALTWSTRPGSTPASARAERE